MRPSIRTFLLINLLLSVTLITSLAIIGNLFLAHKDIQTQLDAQLIRTSLRLNAIFSVPYNTNRMSKIQQVLNNTIAITEEPSTDGARINNAAAKFEARHSIEFQVWNSQ